MLAELSFILSQFTRLTDGQTDMDTVRCITCSRVVRRRSASVSVHCQ